MWRQNIPLISDMFSGFKNKCQYFSEKDEIIYEIKSSIASLFHTLKEK